MMVPANGCSRASLPALRHAVRPTTRRILWARWEVVAGDGSGPGETV